MTRSIQCAVIFLLAPSIASCSTTKAQRIELEYAGSQTVLVKFPDDSRIEPVVDVLGADKSAVKVLKVRLTSASDLLGFARENEFHMAIEASTCDQKSHQISGSSIYYAGQVVSPYAPLPSNSGKTANHEYTAFLPLRGMAEESGKPFDLLASPIELCLQLVGGGMTGSSFQSNVVTVPIEWKK